MSTQVESLVCPDRDRLIYDLLTYYQRDIAEPDGRDTLAKLGITDPAVVEYFALGFASGRAMGAMSEAQYEYLCGIGLARRRKDKLKGSIVVPVYDTSGSLVDLHGVLTWNSGERYVNWQTPPRGLIGIKALQAAGAGDGSLILTDTLYHALHAVQHGYRNVVAIRSVDELSGHAGLLEEAGIKRVYVVSRQQRKPICEVLERIGIEPVIVTAPGDGKIIPADRYRHAMVSSVASPAVADNALQSDNGHATDGRIAFDLDGVRYCLESAAATGLNMRALLRIEVPGVPGAERSAFIDRVDLASASSRHKLAKLASSSVDRPTHLIERDLATIADRVDKMIADAVERHAPRKVKPLTDAERDAAMATLRGRDLLAYMADAIEAGGEFVGEDANKRLALLVAASRLLPKPLGALLRGPAGCGKSSLMRAVMATLPADQVLDFARLTARALYYLPAADLQHKLLVCDEYEGLADSEYALRSLMSSQKLSHAVTVRDNGQMPQTRAVNIPATVAVMVSTTAGVNVENLSRFVELGLNDSPDQSRRVMAAMACGPRARPRTVNGRGMSEAQHVNHLLRPCSVVVPYADQIVYSHHGVLARRRFEQIMGLISAHAALHQHQRPTVATDGEGDGLVIEATKADYEAVYPLLAMIVDHFEEDVSPMAMRLLRYMHEKAMRKLTRSDVIDRLGWSYSQARRVLRELADLDLMVPDRTTNGVLHTYEVAPYQLLGANGCDDRHAVGTITPPDAIDFDR